MDIEFEPYGETVRIESFVPVSSQRQTIGVPENVAGDISSELIQEPNGRKIVWNYESSTVRQITYAFHARTKAAIYDIDQDLKITQLETRQPDGFLDLSHLEPPGEELLDKIFDEEVVKTGYYYTVVSSIFEYGQSLNYNSRMGATDFATTINLREGSSRGINRVVVALARKAGIPARLAGGLDLNTGTISKVFYWSELYVAGHWVPFDPVNNHFASIPNTYLKLFTGDDSVIKHTANIDFSYLFTIRKKMVVDAESELTGSPSSNFSAWTKLINSGLPLDFLKVILLLPLGATVVVICRNVVGINTYGVFLPALIATACRDTGLGWGLLGFGIIIAVVAVINYPLNKWHLLHTPKMTVMLTFVVAALLGLAIVGSSLEYIELSYMTLFPVIILTVTAEKFAHQLEEEGLSKALKLTMSTAVVIAICYVTMESRVFEILFLTFPELFLILVAINLWIGTWVGVRLLELRRFRFAEEGSYVA